MSRSLSRTLIVMRHGRAETGSLTGGDRERHLTPQGRGDVAAVGRLLAGRAWDPAVVLCSDAMRTRETWAQLEVSFPQAEIRFSSELYGASVSTVFDLLAEIPDETQNVMLVGHNPTFSELVEYLAGKSTPMHPADAVVLVCEAAGWADRQRGNWNVTGRFPSK
jgi:phosphohistidine phosphatase